jgi:hypothetical protein
MRSSRTCSKYRRCDVYADALENMNQTAVGLLVASTLSTSEKLGLAVAGDNAFVQFCCLYQVLSDHRTPKNYFRRSKSNSLLSYC